MAELLTSAPAVRRWLSDTPEPAADDPLVNSLIGAVSRFILQKINRPSLLPGSVSEVYDGTGSGSLLLWQWPVLSVTSLSIGGMVVPAGDVAVQPWTGYVLDAWNGIPPGQSQRIQLSGYSFARGPRNVLVTYERGYRYTEAMTVDASNEIIPSQPYGPWALSISVANASGTLLTKVASSPSANQYAIETSNPARPIVYKFNAAQAGQTMTLVYGYVPADLSHCATELVGEHIKYRNRIGQTSRSMGGVSDAFSIEALQPWQKATLDLYTSVIPIW